MLYLYDNAIANDLRSAIDPEGKMNANVKVIDAAGITGLAAQLGDDKITFPLICLVRDADITLDSSRSNFSRAHFGHSEVIDPETNTLYLEKSVPIDLKYGLHILTTNTADMDEIVRELIFRYTSTYFISMHKPYESKTRIRFGISIPPGTQIRRESGPAEYINQGKLYESIIPISCEGAVLLSYTPKHMERIETQIKVESSSEP